MMNLLILEKNIKGLIIFLCFVILICTFCYFSHHRIDRSVVNKLSIFENVFIEITKNEKHTFWKRKRIDLKYKNQIDAIKNDCNACHFLEKVQLLKAENLLDRLYFVDKQEGYFYIKSDQTWDFTTYSHTLIYNEKEVPKYENTEGDTQFELIKQERIKENWYYRIEAIYN